MKKLLLTMIIFAASCSLFEDENNGKKDDIRFLNDIIAMNNLSEQSSLTDYDNGDGEFTFDELGLQKWKGDRLTELELSFSGPVDTILYEISVLPASIGKADKLRYLVINFTSLETLPDEICQMNSLQALHLYSNKIKMLPDNIGSLSSLKVLVMSLNRLTQLPSSVVDLENLESLYLTNNQLTELPQQFWKLNEIRNLDLALNQLEQLPDGIDQIGEIYDLNISSNKLSTLPAGLENLSIYLELDLGNNQLFCNNGVFDDSLIPEYLKNNPDVRGLYNQNCGN